MKTDDLIGLLATAETAPPPAGDLRRLGLGALIALPVMVAAVAATLGLIPPSLWPVSGTLPKLAYAALLLASALILLRRVGRPGSGVALPLVLLGGTLVLAQAVGLADLADVPPDRRLAHMVGHSAPVCPVAILLLSVPALAVTLHALRALAPVNLRLAGAAAGLVAGSLGAVAYTLGCTEGALTFVSMWYSTGILLATALGAAVGPRLLRW